MNEGIEYRRNHFVDMALYYPHSSNNLIKVSHLPKYDSNISEFIMGELFLHFS